MGHLLLNTQFETVDFVESYDSLIWTDRYDKAGDFEIFTGLSPQAIAFYQKDFYIWSDESEHQMIIEDVEIEKNEEDAITLAVTGRSLESILDRRIIWNLTVLKGNLQTGIKKLLDENAIVPAISSRELTGLVFEASTDPAITGLTVDIQLLGENLYDVIQALCEVNEIGFKITMNDTNQLVFKLYSGVDRSYDQVVNPQAVFSPNFDNIGTSKYFTSRRTRKTTARVAGEVPDTGSQVFAQVSANGGAGFGLERREIFIESSSTTRGEGGTTISPSDYLAILQLEGFQELAENVETSIFDGEVITTDSFNYNEDFGMGDIVQLEDIYVSEALAKSRVVEFIRSRSPQGNKSYPTLRSVK